MKTTSILCSTVIALAVAAPAQANIKDEVRMVVANHGLSLSFDPDKEALSEGVNTHTFNFHWTSKHRFVANYRINLRHPYHQCPIYVEAGRVVFKRGIPFLFVQSSYTATRELR